MIEYFLHTGLRATGENYYIDGNINNGAGTISSRSPLINHVSINSVTLLETLAEISTVGQVEVINNSGDFFLSGFQLRNETGFTDFSQYDNNDLEFDIITSGEHSFFENDTFTGLMTGFSGQAGSISNEEQIFLNGIKLVSGEHYNLNSNGNFVWLDSNGVTGKLFTMPKNNQYYNTGSYDILNIRFNRGTSIGYLNGVKLDNESILETSTILTPIIDTGINDIIEFNSERNATTIFL